uniref:Reverse transcriptase domain-containing protein n=1 Tax=Nicotiana tabacum TaxID=4097 RepID=A0A1S4DKX1_TOBAC|nr:PREDICTED: uncharacterized protein LOC107830884 [Nicotiana tabacum]
MGLHQGSAFNPFLFSLLMDAPTHHIQGKVSWYMLFADEIVQIDETRGGVNERLGICRQTLEFKGFKLSTTKIEYPEYKFNAELREVGMDVRLGSQVIRKIGSFNIKPYLLVIIMVVMPLEVEVSQGGAIREAKDGSVIGYASRELKVHEKNYLVHELELIAIVYAMKIWRHYMYDIYCEVKYEHQKPGGLIRRMEIPEWN